MKKLFESWREFKKLLLLEVGRGLQETRSPARPKTSHGTHRGEIIGRLKNVRQRYQALEKKGHRWSIEELARLEDEVSLAREIEAAETISTMKPHIVTQKTIAADKFVQKEVRRIEALFSGAAEDETVMDMVKRMMDKQRAERALSEHESKHIREAYERLTIRRELKDSSTWPRQVRAAREGLEDVFTRGGPDSAENIKAVERAAKEYTLAWKKPGWHAGGRGATKTLVSTALSVAAAITIDWLHAYGADTLEHPHGAQNIEDWMEGEEEWITGLFGLTRPSHFSFKPLTNEDEKRVEATQGVVGVSATPLGPIVTRSEVRQYILRRVAKGIKLPDWAESITKKLPGGGISIKPVEIPRAEEARGEREAEEQREREEADAGIKKRERDRAERLKKYGFGYGPKMETVDHTNIFLRNEKRSSKLLISIKKSPI